MQVPATKAKKGTPKAVVEKGTPKVYEASDKPRLIGITLEGIGEPFTLIYKQSDLDDDEEYDQESETPSEEKVVKKPKAKAKAKKKSANDDKVSYYRMAAGNRLYGFASDRLAPVLAKQCCQSLPIRAEDGETPILTCYGIAWDKGKVLAYCERQIPFTAGVRRVLSSENPGIIGDTAKAPDR